MEPLKFEKQVIANIEKCYSVCPMEIDHTPGFLIATEKAGGCFFFNLSGEKVATIWDDPGGVMSLVPVPQTEDVFLSTQEFYSPNDSANARIVLASPYQDRWQVKKVVDLPFVHRFDILSTPHQDYLIACTLKSDHHFKEDWTHPGKVLVCPLAPGFAGGDDEPQFEVLIDNLTKNHGYYRSSENGFPFALVSSENGIFKVIPPINPGKDWLVEKILDQATSDATLLDLTGDGIPELVTLSPFHGDDLNIYHLVDGKYQLEYAWPEKLEFLHAIWSGSIAGQPVVVLGHRQGKRDLFLLRYDHDQKTYIRQTIDEDCGPANATYIDRDELKAIIATNRETNEVAMYRLIQ
jgi:hypothetical protein